MVNDDDGVDDDVGAGGDIADNRRSRRTKGRYQKRCFFPKNVWVYTEQLNVKLIGALSGGRDMQSLPRCARACRRNPRFGVLWGLTVCSEVKMSEKTIMFSIFCIRLISVGYFIMFFSAMEIRVLMSKIWKYNTLWKIKHGAECKSLAKTDKSPKLKRKAENRTRLKMICEAGNKN